MHGTERTGSRASVSREVLLLLDRLGHLGFHSSIARSAFEKCETCSEPPYTWEP